MLYHTYSIYGGAAAVVHTVIVAILSYMLLHMLVFSVR